MKAHLFSKMSQGLLLLSALLATSCKESSNNFFVPDHEAPSLVSVTPANGETAEENNTILLTFNEYVVVSCTKEKVKSVTSPEVVAYQWRMVEHLRL